MQPLRHDETHAVAEFFKKKKNTDNNHVMEKQMYRRSCDNEKKPKAKTIWRSAQAMEARRVLPAINEDTE